MTLKPKAILGIFGIFVIFAVMFFVPAGTLKFWQGWAYLGTVFGFWAFAITYFYAHDPELIERRMRRKEKVTEQQRIMFVVKIIIVALYLVPGFDHRFAWSHVPAWLTILALVLVLAGYVMTSWVMKCNSYASRVVEVEAGQTVTTTGPYAIVRHPMYLGMGVMCLATPLALGSYYAIPAGVLAIPLLMLRLLNEEKLLRQEPPGYPEYCQQTRFRLIPSVW